MAHLDDESLDPTLNELTHRVIGAAIEVHRLLGPGLLEAVYEEAVCIELSLRGIPFVRQPPFVVTYKDRPVAKVRFDLVVDGKLLVELKAVEAIGQLHSAQVLTYMKVANVRLALLINFNVPELRKGIKRLINRTHCLVPYGTTSEEE